MIWNFGKIYREIRKAKHISQSKICSHELSRSTLSKIENCKLIPSFEIMNYLLNQINVSFEEFIYLCNGYHSTNRDILCQQVYKQLRGNNVHKLNTLVENCESFLNQNTDLYVYIMTQFLKIKSDLCRRNIDKPNINIALAVYHHLEKCDNWYWNDFILCDIILFDLPFESVKQITTRLLHSLSKYDNYHITDPLRCRLLINLSTIYLYHYDYKTCILILTKCLKYINVLKRYDYIAIYHIRMGICQKSKSQINTGVSMLQQFDDKYTLSNMKDEVMRFY